MYYSASLAAKPKLHCVGVATASNVIGPYVAQDEPIICPTDQGGAIDAAGYETNGQRYIVYKVVSLSDTQDSSSVLNVVQDGNSLGNGGLCNNAGKHTRYVL